MDNKKTLSLKRAFTGYSPISVLEIIQSTQEAYQIELTSLKEKIMVEREMNQKLKEEEVFKNSIPSIDPIDKNINPLVKELTEQLNRNRKSIADLKDGLEEQVSIYRQELKLKRQQKYLAKKRIQGSLELLKTLGGTKTEFQKKQRV